MDGFIRSIHLLQDMGRGKPTAVLTGVVGAAVLATLEYTLRFGGNYYAVPDPLWTSPGLVELAVVATGITGASTLVIGVLAFATPHPRATLSSTLVSMAVLARPAYAHLVSTEVSVTLLAVLGVCFAGGPALFVIVVHGRLVLSRWSRSRRLGRATGQSGNRATR